VPWDIETLTRLLDAPALSALIGGITGVAGGYFTGYLAYHRDKQERGKATLAAVKAEISSILSLMEEARYIDEIKSRIDSIEKTGEPAFFEVPVKIKLFTKVYSANISHLGLIDGAILPNLVTFYALVHGLVMDLEHLKFRPGPYSPEYIAGLLKIYKYDLPRLVRTVALAKQIVNPSEEDD
jgi:hypothetical protein